MPLRERKAVLKQLLGDRHDLLVMDDIPGEGSRLFQVVCELDLEGILAKRMSDPYCPRRNSSKSPTVILTEGRPRGAV
jgi:bifunctional non-homologous end joining protein LigD